MCVVALRRLREEDHGFTVSLSYPVGRHLKKAEGDFYFPSVVLAVFPVGVI